MLAKDNNSMPPRQNGEGVPAKRAGERSDNAVHNSSQNINKNMRPKKAHIFYVIPRLEGATSVTRGVTPGSSLGTTSRAWKARRQ